MDTTTAATVPWYIQTIPTEFVYGQLTIGSFIKAICQEGWYYVIGFTTTHALLCQMPCELWGASCLDADNVLAFFDATQLKMEGC